MYPHVITVYKHAFSSCRAVAAKLFVSRAAHPFKASFNCILWAAHRYTTSYLPVVSCPPLHNILSACCELPTLTQHLICLLWAALPFTTSYLPVVSCLPLHNISTSRCELPTLTQHLTVTACCALPTLLIHINCLLWPGHTINQSCCTGQTNSRDLFLWRRFQWRS